MSEKGIARRKGLVFLGTAFWTVIGLFILYDLMLNEHTGTGENQAASALGQLRQGFDKFRSIGPSGYPGMYPNGCGSPRTNSGKFCGLYYEMNNSSDLILLIDVSLAAADCRGDGDTDGIPGNGLYIPSVNRTGQQYLDPVVFNMHPRMGYWYALLKSHGMISSYNGTYAAGHFGLVTFPFEYGKTGETMFIINEEGTVYSKDNENRGYIDTYPADPAAEGWKPTKEMQNAEFGMRKKE